MREGPPECYPRDQTKPHADPSLERSLIDRISFQKTRLVDTVREGSISKTQTQFLLQSCLLSLFQSFNHREKERMAP